jgi:hypothetical protein
MVTKKRRSLKNQNVKKRKNKTQKKRRNGRKMTKRNKYTRNFRTIRNKKYLGGGNWIDNNLPEECSICLLKFSETPELAVYETKCGHKFHNNCLNNTCISGENQGIVPKCPLCRAVLETDDLYQCTDVWAFANKALDASSLNKKNKAIYDAQPDE